MEPFDVECTIHSILMTGYGWGHSGDIRRCQSTTTQQKRFRTRNRLQPPQLQGPPRGGAGDQRMATTRPAICYSEPNGLPPPSTLDTQTSITTLISSGSTLRNCAALCGHGWVHRGRHIAQAVVRLSPRLGSDKRVRRELISPRCGECGGRKGE